MGATGMPTASGSRVLVENVINGTISMIETFGGSNEETLFTFNTARWRAPVAKDSSALLTPQGGPIGIW